MADPQFVGPEDYTSMNSIRKSLQNYEYKLNMKVNIYFEWERQSQLIAKFKKLKSYKPYKILKVI